MKAVICPVCNGVGQVSAGFYSRGGDWPDWVSSGVNSEKCRSCDGKGWVEVHEELSNSCYPGAITIYPDPIITPCWALNDC